MSDIRGQLAHELSARQQEIVKLTNQLRQLELEDAREIIQKYNFTVEELYPTSATNTTTGYSIHNAASIPRDWTNVASYPGAVKVCDVAATSTPSRWVYSNENESVLYSDEKSHVYFITVNDNVVKIGETGNPLGIKGPRTSQPISGTRCRLGRLSSHGSDTGDTDYYIRTSLVKEVKSGEVSIWAIPLPTYCGTFMTPAGTVEIETSSHKIVETILLTGYKENVGRLPILNKSIK